MTRTGLTMLEHGPSKVKMRRWGGAAIAFIAALPAGGCVNVTAPDKPIEINLNINVKQEVVYRLDNQAKTVIQSNPGIF